MEWFDSNFGVKIDGCRAKISSEKWCVGCDWLSVLHRVIEPHLLSVEKSGHNNYKALIIQLEENDGGPK